MGQTDKGRDGKPDDPSQNEGWLLNNTLMRMRDAEADKNWHGRWTNFKFAFNRILCYLSQEAREILEADWKKMVELEQAIKKMKTDQGYTISTESQQAYLDTLHCNFIDAHAAYVFHALPRMGIINIQAEGLFDFSRHDFDELSAIINATPVGVLKAIEKVQAENEDAEEVVTPEQEQIDESTKE